MLILLLITVSSLTLGTAEDKLIEDHFGHEQVRDILDKVNKDLGFVRVLRNSDQCNYNQIMDEIQNSLEPNLFLHRSVIGQIQSPQQFEEVVMLLGRDDPEGAIKVCSKIAQRLNDSETDHLWNEVWVRPAQSYLHYLMAEAFRKLGNHRDSLYHLIEASFVRQTAKGISVNELEKSNALIALQRVVKFNQDVDDLGNGGLEGCLSDSEKCRANEITVRKHTYQNLSSKNKQIFKGQCVTSQVVNSALDRFEKSLRMLGLGGDRPSSVLGHDLTSAQVQKLEELLGERNVRKLLDTNGRQTAFDADELWQQLRNLNLDPEIFKFKPHNDEEWQTWTDTFIDYCKAEAYRRSSNCNRLLSSEVMLDRIKQSKVHNGLSLKAILELEGKIVLKSLVCLIRRIETIYQLDGQESTQVREKQRSLFGGSENLLPQIVPKNLHQDLIELKIGSH